MLQNCSLNQFAVVVTRRVSDKSIYRVRYL